MIRAKGLIYFSHNRDMSFLFEQAGVQKKLVESGFWFATAPEEELRRMAQYNPDILKDWDEKKKLYNLAGALHDWLYATEGDDMMFSRSECDDIFRGILREAGVGRFKAGAADLAVGIFAGNRRHWGSDSYKVGELVHLSVFV